MNFCHDYININSLTCQQFCAIINIVLSVRKDCLTAPEYSLSSVKCMKSSLNKTLYDVKNNPNYKWSLKRGIV